MTGYLSVQQSYMGHGLQSPQLCQRPCHPTCPRGLPSRLDWAARNNSHTRTAKINALCLWHLALVVTDGKVGLCPLPLPADVFAHGWAHAEVEQGMDGVVDGMHDEGDGCRQVEANVGTCRHQAKEVIDGVHSEDRSAGWADA